MIFWRPAWFSPLPNRVTFQAGADAPKALESYLDQQRVALPGPNTLEQSPQALGIYTLNVPLP